MPGVLEGTRVIDFGQYIAGPMAAMLLGDQGADVIRIDPPGGPRWNTPANATWNRNKRSITLDLKKDADRETARQLIAGADVVIENFKVGGADRLGVGYEQVRERNPTVVYCSITGFGSEREPSGRPGYDFVAQAESGLMSITGPEDGPPYKVGVALVDVLTGLHAAAGVLAALHGGEGGRIEVPLLDSGLAGLVNVAQNALVTGREPERHGNAHPNIVPYQAFETSSGRIAVAAANDGLFRSLCSAMGVEELSSDERFATNAVRVEHRGELVPLLAARFSERSAEEWLADLEIAGVPSGKVRSVPDALAAAAAAGRPATMTVEHPTAGPLDLVASPIWGATRTQATPPPLLGEHTAEVLGELGRSAEEIEALAEQGVIGICPPMPDKSG